MKKCENTCNFNLKTKNCCLSLLPNTSSLAFCQSGPNKPIRSQFLVFVLASPHRTLYIFFPPYKYFIDQAKQEVVGLGPSTTIAWTT